MMTPPRSDATWSRPARTISHLYQHPPLPAIIWHDKVLAYAYVNSYSNARIRRCYKAYSADDLRLTSQPKHYQLYGVPTLCNSVRGHSCPTQSWSAGHFNFKNTVDSMDHQLSAPAREVTRVGLEAGAEGRLGGRAHADGVQGEWLRLIDHANTIVDNAMNHVQSTTTDEDCHKWGIDGGNSHSCEGKEFKIYFVPTYFANLLAISLSIHFMFEVS
ncbi:hypothetical protein DL96DRAFT_1687909 [Flagelloscypha sp. PMI_526]|nr:hypothetical protein DL96DRAFT_1687909 [Flagelloscypha sp. PMI_526]